MMTKEAFRAACFASIEKAQRVVITSHTSPDDDSIGSVLSMRQALIDRFPEKDIRIVYTGVSIDRYSIFSGYDQIQWVDDIADHIEGVDVLITLDASNWRRFTKKESILAAVPVRIGIDHHASEPDEYTLLYKDEAACANTALIHDIFFADGTISKQVAEYLLLGINGDTGGLSYVRSDAVSVFTLVGSLVENIGMSLSLFRSRYMGIPIRIMPLLQELVANTTYESISPWPPVQYTYLASTESYTDEEVSAASHIYMSQYLTRIEGYSWGFVITPRNDGTYRMSGRSLEGSVDVRSLHEALGIGSGHVHAAGGYFPQGDSVACITQVLDFMKNNKPMLS